MMQSNYVEQFTAARRIGAPFVVVRTADQFADRDILFAAASGMTKPAVGLLLAWDAARGLLATSKAQQPAFDKWLGSIGMKQPDTVNLIATLVALVDYAPIGSIIAIHNAGRQWDSAENAQALANARDSWKASHRQFLFLVPAGAKAPEEIKSDCVMIDVPLPTTDRLTSIVSATAGGAGLAVEGDSLRRAADGVRGLSAFSAETAIAMSLRKSGVNFDVLLEQRIAAIQQVAGVTVYRGSTPTFADVVGLDGCKRALGRLKRSKRPVRVLVIFDEFEKAMAGSQASHGDSTGIAQRGAGHILSFMTLRKVRGTILFGHPGLGKTFLAQALANELGCICILVDIGATLDSLVGASEKNLRAVTDLIDALGDLEGAFFCATCNDMSVLTTELRRRFNRGLFFLDLPSKAEREAAWQYYCGVYKLDAKQPRPYDEGWTPAEIAVCCEQADDYGISLLDAADAVVPVSTGQPEVIEQRRRNAHGKLIDAATGKTYVMPGAVAPAPTAMEARAITLNE